MNKMLEHWPWLNSQRAPVQQGKNAGIKHNAGKSEIAAVEPLSGCSYRSPGKKGSRWPEGN